MRAGRDQGGRRLGGGDAGIQLPGQERGAGDHAGRRPGRVGPVGLAQRPARGPVRRGSAGRIVDLHVGDLEAELAGLSCGGDARCLLVPAADLPAELWERLRDREPVCLVTAARRRSGGGHRDVRSGDDRRRGRGGGAAVRPRASDTLVAPGRGDHGPVARAEAGDRRAAARSPTRWAPRRTCSAGAPR